MKNYNSEIKYGGPSAFDYTDLAVERRRLDTDIPGVEYKCQRTPLGKLEEIRITSDAGRKAIGKPEGIYITLSYPRMDLLDDVESDDAADEVARVLCRICDEGGIIPERILVVGLGNKNLTPDTVGTKSAEIIKPTLHIRELDEETFESLECSEISVISPGVTARTGLEALEIIKGVTRRIMPDLVIAIDSIATRSPERLGCTVQICDTGICPGSGIGNRRNAISRETVGIPVISLGVPTVIDSRVFSGNESKHGMLVSPREIDEITRGAARIIGGAVNQAFGIF